MLKKIFEDIGLTEIFGFVILCFFFASYFYYNPLTIKKSGTQEVVITLSEKPVFSPETHEIPASLKLVDKNYEQRFELKNCSLELVDKIEVLNLEIGEKIRITARTNDLNSGETFVNNYISVIGIESPNGKKILELESYNSCKKKSYKKFNLIGVVFIIFLVAGLIKKIRNKKNVG